MKLKIAQKQQVKLRIGISGPSGFGKTYSALLLGYGMTQDWSNIAIIDTENKSANLYSTPNSKLVSPIPNVGVPTISISESVGT